MIREATLIVLVTSATLGSQLLIKGAIARLALKTPGLTGAAWLAAVVFSPEVILAIALQGVGFLIWVTVISRMKLGVAVGLAGASLYLLLPLVSWWLYGERLVSAQWLGLVLITGGVLLLSITARGG